MGLNETKLDSSIGDDEISTEGYSLVRKDRNTYVGGVALYVHNDIPFINRLNLAYELESISIEVKLHFINRSSSQRYIAPYTAPRSTF